MVEHFVADSPGRELPASTFQARVFAAYEAIHEASHEAIHAAIAPHTHSALAPHTHSAPAGLALDQKGALAGQFIVSDSLPGPAEPLPVACVLAGACYLGMDENVEAARNLLRQGRCDFVVNSLDEALRILKNELRQKRPVAVCLTGEVPVFIQELADRGVAPQLFYHLRSPGEYPALARLHDTGTSRLNISGLAKMLNRAANQDGDLIEWKLPHGNASALARVDAVARDILPENDRKRRRWLEAAARYLPRELPPVRVASLTQSELERFADGVSARIMSRDVPGPVEIATSAQRMSLDAESAA